MNATTHTWDVAKIRADFPILSETQNGRPIAYLDNAATSQKPRAVLDTLNDYWTTANANVHRGVHMLSQRATKRFDEARETVRIFLNAPDTREIVFTKGCTEAINLVANAATRGRGQSTGDVLDTGLQPGDVILLSQMEHHSNIVPWQIAAEATGAEIRVIPMFDNGELDLDAYRRLLSDHRVRMVGVVFVSNSLGTVNPVSEMARLAHEAGATILVDGAQAGPHRLIDVAALDVDFLTLSCHKIYAPTGVGVLYGRFDLLAKMAPYQGGGDMIRTVSFERTTYAEPPARFEAGTPNVAGVIGLGAAIEYLASLGEASDLRARLGDAFRLIEAEEHELTAYGTAALTDIDGVRMTGTAPGKAGVLAFTMQNAHPHDIGTILDGEGVAIRAGHHCCMPLMQRLGVPATARASLGLYSTREEIDRLVSGVKKVKEMFG